VNSIEPGQETGALAASLGHDFSPALCHPIVVAQTQLHRGPAPMDARLFHAGQLPALRAAVADLCWLLDPGESSAGNHHATHSQRVGAGFVAAR